MKRQKTSFSHILPFVKNDKENGDLYMQIYTSAQFGSFEEEFLKRDIKSIDGLVKNGFNVGMEILSQYGRNNKHLISWNNPEENTLAYFFYKVAFAHHVEAIKEMILHAVVSAKDSVVFSDSDYHPSVLEWLKKEGFDVSMDRTTGKNQVSLNKIEVFKETVDLLDSCSYETRLFFEKQREKTKFIDSFMDRPERNLKDFVLLKLWERGSITKLRFDDYIENSDLKEPKMSVEAVKERFGNLIVYDDEGLMGIVFRLSDEGSRYVKEILKKYDVSF